MVRTSIVSRKSVDPWISSPDMVFEEEECRTAWELIDLVDAVLKNHQGPIRKFKFVTTDHFYAFNEVIARWLIILSKNGIKDLELLRVDNDDMSWDTPIWDIPGDLISSMSLELLSLAGCQIDAKPNFKGLPMVRTLILSEFGLDGTDIKDILSSCPLLDHLELSDFPITVASVSAPPNLTFLHIVNILDDIVLETPKLASGCIHLVERGYGDLRVNKKIDVIRALGHLSSIQKLDMYGEFLQYLAVGPMPENFPAVFYRLTDIFLQFHIHPDEITAVLCLFQNAPNLEILSMEFAAAVDIDQPTEAEWKQKAIKDGTFKRLKVINMTYGDYHDPEWFLQSTNWMLQFAKLVLSSESMLEKVNFINVENVMKYSRC